MSDRALMWLIYAMCCVIRAAHWGVVKVLGNEAPEN
jgi:hypothetical protein